MGTDTFDLVIARYDEDLSWAGGDYGVSVFRKVFVYNKNPGKPLTIGDVPKDKLVVVNLENIGQEAHTYLAHIEKQYDDLATFTIFTPGSANTDPEKRAILECVTKNTFDNHSMTFCGFGKGNTYESMKDFQLDKHASTNTLNPNEVMTPSPDRPGGRFFEAVYGEGSKDTLGTIGKGIFSASRSAIHNRQKQWYVDARDKYLRTANTEAAHFFERTWAVMFNCRDSSCFKLVTPYVVKGFIKRRWMVVLLASAAVLALTVATTVFMSRRNNMPGALPDP